MEILKAMRLTGGRKPNPGGLTDDKALPLPEESTNSTFDQFVKSADTNTTNSEAEEEDDDDFIMNEVKRRLKELRRNSFMALIPEEQSSPEDEEDEEEQGETSSSESRGVDAETRQFWSGFDAFYGRYCERMLFFDGLIVQQLREVGSHLVSVPSPRAASKKLASSFRCLSMKKLKPPEDEMEQLQQPGCDPYDDLDSTYVAQVVSQRFIENEPFEQGLRPERYARMRNSLPKLLQVPKVQGFDQKVTSGETSDFEVLATDVLSLIEGSILTFYQFLRIEKKISGGVQNIHAMASPFQQVQISLEKKTLKLKELRKRRKSWKNNTWPVTQEDVELLLSIIDVKVLARVLKMARISMEQLFWCEEKMKKIDLSNGKVQRDHSPLLFPC